MKRNGMSNAGAAGRTAQIPGTAGGVELVLLSGNALAHLCPAEGERLRK